ncbi:MAG: hypothetical protein AAGF73_18645, partial [Actinomycetota bacterium]
MAEPTASIRADVVDRDTEHSSSNDATPPREHIALGDALPYVAATIGALWMFRSVFSGQLPGNIGDARWTVALHEHWYRVWQGDAALRDLPSFYPVEGTLGTSDAFFAQGQIYAALRTFGAGMIDSWTLTQFLTFLFGTLGLAALSRRTLTTVWGRVAFVALCATSYPVYLQLGHVQLFAIFWPAWIIVAAIDFAADRRRVLSATVLAVLPPVLALSSWYVFVLFFLLTALFLLVR